jgi:DNA-binding PadR family transcriptional regulator
MAPALRRHLQELPWVGDGLSLTQRLALQSLVSEPRTISEMFSDLQVHTEPLPFLGDLMFLAVLRGLEAAGAVRTDAATAEQKWPSRVLHLTDAGEALLAGRLDWMTLEAQERWVGGVRIVPGLACWRWDRALDRPVWTSY